MRHYFVGSFLCFSSCFAFDSADLSLEEKVGQLLMVHFYGEVANIDAHELICETKVGGIIYYNWSNGLNSPSQVKNLSEGLQALAAKNPHPVPLIIAVDQEGGRVTRLKEGFTLFPGNGVLGELGDLNLTEEQAFCMGSEMKAVGITLNLAPVVDVNCNPQNPVIGNRSFGSDPQRVSCFAQRALRGFHRAGVKTTLKHFPGHGDVELDSHEDLPIVRKSLAQLEKMELLPFAQLADSSDAVMTAHLLVPALDPDYCSTLSEKTLGYLREKIGFQGVIIADSLIMKGAMKGYERIEEVAVAALRAGCDILLLGGKLLNGMDRGSELSVADIKRVHAFLVAAVKEGMVSEQRVDLAVERILKLKNRG